MSISITKPIFVIIITSKKSDDLNENHNCEGKNGNKNDNNLFNDMSHKIQILIKALP